MTNSIMCREMAEQPRVLASLGDRGPALIDEIRSLLPTPLRGVVVIARGSSLNAGTYLAYAIETVAGIPVSLARPSVFTRYGARPDFTGWMAVALSQSGRTPEIVSASRTIVECGAVLVTVTNDAASKLAQVGSVHVDLAAGPEVAVPATKTVSAQMVSALIMAEALAPRRSTGLLAGITQLSEAVGVVLDDPAPVDRLGEAWATRPGLTVLGRGFGFAAAHEIALKVREVAGILGEAWSVTAFKHGPIAGLSALVPVLVTSMTPTLDTDTADVIAQLTECGNPIAVCGPGADATLSLPTLDGDHAELLMPILAVIRGQQLCGAMALALDLNPDAPAGLNKVTLTN